MRWLALLAIALLLAAPALGADIARNITAEARQGSTINVTLTARGASIDDRFVVGEMIPKGAKMESWSVSGAQEGEGFSFTENGSSLIWEFKATGLRPVITYTVLMPMQGEEAAFDAVYAVSTGEHGRLKNSVTLLAPLPIVPPMLTLPEPAILEAPQPLRPDAPPLPLLLIGTILALSIGLVYIVERSTRMLLHMPFGHHTVELIMHALGHNPQPVMHAQQHIEIPKRIVEEALQAAELAKAMEHVEQATEHPAQPDLSMNRKGEAVVWSSPIFHG